MKKLFNIIFVALLGLQVYSQTKGFSVLENPRFKVDSIHEYFWNDAYGVWDSDGTWKDPYTHIYKYSGNKLEEILISISNTPN